MDREDLLDSLLAVATDELEKEDNEKSEIVTIQNSGLAGNCSKYCKTSNDSFKQIDIFRSESNLELKQRINILTNNVGTDLSNEEGNRKNEDHECNKYGQEIKHILSSSSTLDSTKLENNSISINHYGITKSQITTDNPTTKGKYVSSASSLKPIIERCAKLKKELQDVFIDPIFGMRIVNPLVSSSLLKERMHGRLAVRFGELSRHINAGGLKNKDWVICGVIANKSPPKKSQNGSQYSIWTLSDLKDDLQTLSLFMFSSANKDLWKTAIGTVIGVLNPNIMEQKDVSKNETADKRLIEFLKAPINSESSFFKVSLSLSTPQKVMIFGQSRDFGICKSIKKNGEKCTAIVNLSKCEYCLYHIKQEYQKCSKRSELQANYAGQGLANLRNKVLGKNEVFYAGKSYMSIPAKKSQKLETKNLTILRNLNGMNENTTSTFNQKDPPNKRKRVARHIDVNPAQRAKDLKLLEKLGGTSDMKVESQISGHRSKEITSEDSRTKFLNVSIKPKVKENVKKDHVNPTNKFNIRNDIFTDAERENRLLETISMEKGKSKNKCVILKLEAKKKPDYIEKRAICHNDNQDMLPLDNLEKISVSTKSIKNDFKQDSISAPKSSDDENHESLGNICPITLSTDITIGRFEKTQTPLFHISKSTTKDYSRNHNDNLTTCTLKNTRLSERCENLKITEAKCTTSIFISHSNRSNENEPNNPDSMVMSIPSLSRFKNCDQIDLDKPIITRHIERAKINAIQFIQRHGTIKKIDPNNTKGSGIKKRNIETGASPNNDENPSKKSKLQEKGLISDRFKKMIAMTSKHASLLEHHDNEEKEKYFKKLEIKEQMEEKMVNTHKVKCKAVRCLQCKYTSSSASELCKTERHSLKVFDAMKRFYKCSNCQNRSVTLELVPTRPCNNCGSTKWEKTGMMKEKIAAFQHNLSIRGGEQKFLNSVIADANLDLLVPDDQ